MKKPGLRQEAVSRRGFLATAAGGAALVATPAMGVGDDAPLSTDPLEMLPTMDPELARQVVLYSHTQIDRVRLLVERHPELAKSAIDWGFGDWETALGAASHMGQREIAQLLLDHGARMNIFTAAMVGHVDVVRAAVESSPGVQRVRGPHGITLLSHAKAGKLPAVRVLEYLESLGDADQGYTNLPLEQSEIDSNTGEYAYGPEPVRRFGIEHKRSVLRFTRQGRFPRNLFHQGDLEFHPAGAPSVRISFVLDGVIAQAVSLNITDPPLVARRVG